ncbi:EAL domain-containing protein (putative c-di-GMP-specific phosphodiesterase class I) [Litorivivens lipolytica]|uniref:EAL domain-containing protein (Putative c-di-GMP-specific phosphodiesterase class I) n=1 Tax=Litorivivens lipolytica TaxID=1524264 RepID=A0A7W4W470_9GAMM|nr:EAL domain-containing response regulator [Litorivivens lipolytica]MBB3047153.1 EAL domain-containing protein (putative c-di-GMP-specific phosphodiesterase class I) [Litorivivens lipolytica]
MMGIAMREVKYPSGTTIDKARVLIVEDDDFQRKIITRQLQSNQLEVLEAGDGAEALHIIRHSGHAVDFILCDLDMPTMDGMEFIRNLSDNNLLIPIALMSAREIRVIHSVELMCEAFTMPTLGSFQKPLSQKQLDSITRQAKVLAISAQSAPSTEDAAFSVSQVLSAIERGEIIPFFQPKFCLRDNRIVGAEALARWQHPTNGFIPPDSFIGLLEQSGNIDQLTLSILEQSCQIAAGWYQQGYNICLAVNLSTVSLQNKALSERICSIVEASGLPNSAVTLEVTESAAIANLGYALENLTRLRMRGFGISIDDFGTGFASMEQLRRIALTELKIDRSFVSTMLEEKESFAIVQSSIEIANRLNLTTVAEGVETEEQRAMLSAATCHHAQGYLFSKPLPADEFEKLLQNIEPSTENNPA